MAAPVPWAIRSALPARASLPRWCMHCARAVAAVALRRYVSAAVKRPPSRSKFPAELQVGAQVRYAVRGLKPPLQDRSMKIADARAVITGGASGLGLAVARHITKACGRVTLLDVQEGPGQAAAASLGGSAAFVKCDVTSEEEVNAAMES